MGRLVGEPSAVRPERREVRRQPVRDQLDTGAPAPACRAAGDCRASRKPMPSPTSPASARAAPTAGPAAVAGGHDPGRPVHLEARVVAAAEDRLARVDAHADAHLASAGHVVRRKRRAGPRPPPATAWRTDGKTAKIESPSLDTSVPPLSETASPRSRKWSRQQRRETPVPRSRTRRVEPSMSVIRYATVPCGRSVIRER